MNSWSWNHIWIHNMSSWSWNHNTKSYMKYEIYEIIHEFIIWIHIWIHDHEEYRVSYDRIQMYEFIFEFMLVIQWWIHDNEIIYEFIIMNSSVNSVLWRILWNNGIPENEFTYEIMVEFISLEVFQIQLQIYFCEGKWFYSSKVITTASLQSAHCKP